MQDLQSPTDGVQTPAQATPAQTIPAALIGTLKLGQHYPEYGGTYCGMVAGEDGAADYPIFCPSDPLLLMREMQWGPYGVDIAGATHRRDGYANTQALLAADDEHPAAKYCAGITYLGFKDYALPSSGEAALIATNAPGLMQERWIWTSTQYSANGAIVQNPYGNQYWLYKGLKSAVLPVRRLSVIH